MKTTNGNWRHCVSISKLPKMLLAFAILTISSLASAQQPLDVTLTPFEYN
ncbi:MAG: hypothetical protein P8P74_01125 [Crocinitomicaceae bacterium]|nr:hypothetical protein [Crocinitomicaceae bacterium]